MSSSPHNDTSADLVAISVNNLWTSYGGTKVHRGVTFTVRQGEYLSLLGRNGSGKSTMLRVLIGSVPPDSGSVSVLNESPPLSRGVLAQVGALVGNPIYVPWMSAQSYLRMLLETAGLRDTGSVDRVLCVFNLQDVRRKRIGRMSQGMRQRLVIAAAFLRDPSLVLLDEPYAHLDRTNAEQLTAFLLEKHQAGTTIIIATHRASEARLTERSLLIEDGIVVYDGAPVAELVRAFLN